MKEAIKNSKTKPEHVLIDAVKLDIDIPSTSIIKGDVPYRRFAKGGSASFSGIP